MLTLILGTPVEQLPAATKQVIPAEDQGNAIAFNRCQAAGAGLAVQLP